MIFALTIVVAPYINTEQVRPIVGDFMRANFKQEVQKNVPEQKKSGYFSKIIEKITPTKVLAVKKQQGRPPLSLQSAADVLISLNATAESLVIADPEMKALELVSGAGHESDKSLFSVLVSFMQPHTMSGKIATANCLMDPIFDQNELENRQSITAFLVQNPRKNIELKYYLEELSAVELSLTELFSSVSLISPVEGDLCYSQIPLLNKVINQFPICHNLATGIRLLPLTITPILTAMSVKLPSMIREKVASMPLDLEDINREIQDLQNDLSLTSAQKELSMIGPMAAKELLYYKQKVSNNTDNVLDVFRTAKNIYGVLGIFKPVALLYGSLIGGSLLLGTVTNTFAFWSLVSAISGKAKEVQKYLIDVAEYVYMCERITEAIENTPELQNTSFGTSFIQFKNNPNLKRLKSLLKRSTFQGSASALCNWGNVFATFKEMEQQKEHFIPLIKAVGELDMYCGLAHLMRMHGNNGNQVQFCFAQYVQNDTPIIRAVDFWNPFVLTHKPMQDIVTNTITFDAADAQNGIFTGPNTCGKTTVIIAIMLNAILAQTFGIAAAKQFVLTPFSKFNATLTVTTDGAIGDSRFKSEVREAQKVLHNVTQAAKQGLFTLTIQDEIFTGTNQRDGEVAAYSFLQKIGKFGNNITLLATHYVDKLTTLGAPFANFKINAELKNGTEVIRHYTVSQGISDLNIAHIIAAQAGL